MNTTTKYTIIKIKLVALTVFLGVAFFAWTVYPNLQIASFHRALKKTIKTGDTAYVMSNPFFFEPYTNVQPMLRFLFTALLVIGYNGDTTDTPVKLMTFAIDKLEETLPTTVPYLNTYLNLGKGYDILGMVNTDLKQRQVLFTKASGYYQQALDLVPNQQTTVIAYGMNLYNRGKINEAAALLRSSIAQDAGIPDLHYYLGQFLYYQDEKNSPESLREIEISLNAGMNISPSLTQQTYQKMLFYFYKTKDKENMLTTLSRLVQIDQKQAGLYSGIISYIRTNNKIPILELNKLQ